MPGTPKVAPTLNGVMGSFGQFQDYNIKQNIISVEQKYNMGLSEVKEGEAQEDSESKVEGSSLASYSIK